MTALILAAMLLDALLFPGPGPGPRFHAPLLPR
jgi:hypothetical protein